MTIKSGIVQLKIRNSSWSSKWRELLLFMIQLYDWKGFQTPCGGFPPCSCGELFLPLAQKSFEQSTEYFFKKNHIINFPKFYCREKLRHLFSNLLFYQKLFEKLIFLCDKVTEQVELHIFFLGFSNFLLILLFCSYKIRRRESTKLASNNFIYVRTYMYRIVMRKNWLSMCCCKKL